MVSSALASADWPAFRGGMLSGVGAGTPPSTWNVAAGTNIVWRTPVPGGGHSSPVVSGSRVFVTTAVPASGTRTGIVLGDSSRSGIDSASDTGRHEWRIIALDRALIADMKPEAMETFTPPAMGGDVDLRSAKERIGRRVCMIGGFDQFHFFNDCSEEKVRAEVRRCFKDAGEGGRYILSPSDHFFDADINLVKAFADEARKCVYK